MMYLSREHENLTFYLQHHLKLGTVMHVYISSTRKAEDRKMAGACWPPSRKISGLHLARDPDLKSKLEGQPNRKRCSQPSLTD